MKRDDLDLDMETYAEMERIAIVAEGAKVDEWRARKIVERQMREQAEAQRELPW